MMIDIMLLEKSEVVSVKIFLRTTPLTITSNRNISVTTTTIDLCLVYTDTFLKRHVFMSLRFQIDSLRIRFHILSFLRSFSPSLCKKLVKT